MRLLALKWAAALAALLFLFPAFAGANVLKQPGHFVFPGSDVVLQDGDIILTNSGGLFSALNKQYGFPRGPYSHASVYIEGSESGGVLVDFSTDGLIERSPDLGARRSVELALIRPKAAPSAGALAAALKQLKSRPLRFDYDMRWPDVGSNSTYCAGLISQLYRLAGMPDPFPPGNVNEIRRDFMAQWASKHLELDLAQIVSPNQVLAREGFELLAEYKPGDITAALPRIITAAVVQKVDDYLGKDGLGLQAPKSGSRFILGLVNSGVLDGVVLAHLPEKRREAFFALNEYVQKVRMRVERYIRIHDGTAWNEQDVVEVTRAVADQYRDIYFIRADAAPSL